MEEVAVDGRCEALAGLLDTEAAARLLGVRPRTLAEWRKRGVGPAFVRLGRKHSRVLYRTEDLEAFVRQVLEANVVEGGAIGSREAARLARSLVSRQADADDGREGYGDE